MTITTNVPDIVFGQTGLVLPAESAVLSGVQADINNAFGGGVNPALETPQGQLASSTAAIIGAKNDLVAEYVNQVDPAFADGRMQDAIARIYFIRRKPAASTAIVCTCVGAVNTPIPVGAMAKATDGTIYLCMQAGTIPLSGTIDLPFSAQITGPIACPANSCNQIYKAIPGWDTVNNSADGTMGTLVESRADFEYRRKNSVALNAHGSIESIYAAVFNVENVFDVYAFENEKGTTQNVGSTNYPMLSHSIYVAAMGGLAADIAAAIWSKKNDGSDYNGNTSVVVTDQSGYNPPYPTYTVKYEVPAALPILFAVQITNSPSLPSNIVALVQQAIINAFSGADGGSRARIGSTIFASRYYGPVSLIDPAVSIISILIGTTTATLNSVNVGIDQSPTVVAANISVTLV
ncbi:MAG: hypothetical protein EPN62_00735 [Candidimonas sp.]|nr:MAG: hypothetical protein EPN77_01735 [Candidimonas sp.]TAM26856.1 MAG: hypothetical protein EPN62_00735 [Candidimonas sp.]